MTTSTPSTPGTELHTRWRGLAAPFTAEVEAVTAWDAPSPCEGWSARDVLAHVIGTEREFLAKAGLLSGGGAEAEAEDPAARWAAHLAEVDALLDDGGNPVWRRVGLMAHGSSLLTSRFDA